MLCFKFLAISQLMRTWLLITLQRYGGWKEYLGYEKGMVILYPFKMKWYKKKKPRFSSMRNKAYDICYKLYYIKGLGIY